MNEESKRTLRREAIARRKLVDPTARMTAGERLAALADRLPLSAPTQPDTHVTVAAYVSMGSEIETRPLLDALLAAGYRMLVPRLGAGLDVGWGELAATGLLARMDAPGSPAHHRPDEPEGETLPPQSLEDASLVLVPALAVDRCGTRLGRGGGWYDRALGYRSPGCPVLAVCWDWEVRAVDADPLPREAHDLPVDGALTPGGIMLFD